MDLRDYLTLGAYAFAAGNYVWTWWVYRELTNHMNTRVTRLENAEQARHDRRPEAIGFVVAPPSEAADDE